MREAESSPILLKLHQWAEEQQAVTPPKSKLGQAINYLLNQWVALNQYIKDGALPIDNTALERIHRTVAVGRNNWLFCGSDVGGKRTAVLYTIHQSCLLNGIDPEVYIADILMQLEMPGSAARLRDLLPDRWRPYHETQQPKTV